MSTAIERLERVLNEKDEEIAQLREELQRAEWLALGSNTAWSQPYDLSEDNEDYVKLTAALPIPRLEFIWDDMSSGFWRNYRVEYRLVSRHLLGHIQIRPFGSTTINSSGERAPYSYIGSEHVRGGISLPYRDGAHAHYDAAILGVPLYAITPDRVERLDGDPDYAHQVAKAHGHARRP